MIYLLPPRTQNCQYFASEEENIDENGTFYKQIGILSKILFFHKKCGNGVLTSWLVSVREVNAAILVHTS